MKKLFIFLLIGGVASWGLTGCMDTENGGNYQTTPVMPVVVKHNPEKGITTVLTYVGEVAVPEFSKLDQNDCLLTQLKIDYDNQPQPSPGYYVATVVDYLQVDAGSARVEDEFSIGDFTLPIEDMGIYPYTTNNGILVLDGRYFVQIKHTIPKDQGVNYKLVAARDSVDEKTGVQNVYLLAKGKNENDGKASEVQNIHAFDLKDIFALGRDTTLNEVKLKYIKINLKYFNGEKEGEPVFKKLNTSPIELAIYK
ncbi:MAG: hypothetical protein LBO74_13010 [Candidatus Symbiothrix sp.]|jgi:hypothetical protein|nr:hypothetical protein [Candidatus Symbiothrix sp.]